MKQVIRYILSAVLAMALIILIFVSIISSTILNEKYVLSKLDETGYYANIYKDVQSNFENYIYQSGLDESVLENIVSEEKIKEDTKSIISHIYNSVGEEITGDEIKEKLNSNIDESLKNVKLNSSQKTAIETFVNTITKEYTNTILHFGIEKDVNSIYHKIFSFVELVKKAILVLVAVCAIMLVLITLKRVYRIFTFSAMSCLATGTFLIVVNLFTNAKINVQAISILNDAMSGTLRNIVSEILQSIMNYGIVLLVVGIITIILANLLHNIKKYKKAYKHSEEE